jgi:hypothetical protein
MAAYKGGQEFHGKYTDSKNHAAPHPDYTEDMVNGAPGPNRSSPSQAEGKPARRMIADVTGGPGLSDRLPKR